MFYVLHGLLWLAMALAGLPAPAAMASEPACRGRDMLAELAGSDPEAHARLSRAAAAASNTEALLWRIEKPGLAPSHLLGTVHLSDDRVAKLSPKVMAAIGAARAMALEVADLSPAAMAKALGQTAGLFVYAGERGLADALEPEELEKAKALLLRSGLPGEFAAKVRPWLVFMLLSTSDCERRRTGAGLPVLDMRLAEEGRRRRIRVVGLETLEGQLRMLAAIPEAQQVAMLKATLKLIDRRNDLMETMLLLYVRRQMGLAIPFQHELARRAGVAEGAYAAFESELIVRRNAGMAAAARPLLEQGGAFIGVGALHLIGPTGLVELIRAAGFTVSAVE
jgi:hypothetical protein